MIVLLWRLFACWVIGTRFLPLKCEIPYQSCTQFNGRRRSDACVNGRCRGCCQDRCKCELRERLTAEEREILAACRQKALPEARS